MIRRYIGLGQGLQLVGRYSDTHVLCKEQLRGGSGLYVVAEAKQFSRNDYLANIRGQNRIIIESDMESWSLLCWTLLV